jgi:acyl dehydratase
MADILYFEDLVPGRRFVSGTLTVTADEIVAFARLYDPQPFHLDHEAALGTMFKGLAASGWHTAALTMRLLTAGVLPVAGGVIGRGADLLEWPRPTRPGDTLQVFSEVIEARVSASRPDMGWIKMRNETRNQNGDVVQVFVPNMPVPRRPAG